MTKIFRIFFILIVLMLYAGTMFSQDIIEISTNKVSLVYKTRKGKIFQAYLGQRLRDSQDYKQLSTGKREAYITSGTTNLYEPAIQVIHNDGNPSLDLYFLKSETKATDSNTVSTSVWLADSLYAVEIVLRFMAYRNEDIIKMWAEITNYEKKPVVLNRFASAVLYLNSPEYWLTQFHGDWAYEMNMEESLLTSGIKIIDSKLGTRADMYQTPVFFLSTEKSSETAGELIAGTLAWSGNFQLLFEIDKSNMLRILPGLNPYNSNYNLMPGKKFSTPEFIFTYSNNGKGVASRNFHKWARNYGILNGNHEHLTLFNNWEATGYDFNEERIIGMFDDAADFGVDLFLLDDGWYGNKYPRDNAEIGLGDWQTNRAKLPNGLGNLVKTAHHKGIKFGIWIEPEMVNPKSQLYEKHPDWIIRLPNRDETYFRYQLVLDLTNPKVQDFIVNTVDNLMIENQGISYLKWDCNRMMTSAYSPYLKENQSHLYIDYVHGFYSVMERLRKKYPLLPIMLCSGGGGRTDYGALKYFTEFWPSDNTDPVERIYIQWGYSCFFPSFALCSHITSWGDQSLKFKFDVAMMGKLGFDIDPDKLSDNDRLFLTNAMTQYQEIKDVVWRGDLYRLISPYEENRAVLMYADAGKEKAVLFSYNMNCRYGEEFCRVKLQGLDPCKKYRIKEVNLYPGTFSKNEANGKSYSGDYLMKVGISVHPKTAISSKVFIIIDERIYNKQ